MSRIDDLIRKHCPEGVPHRELGGLLGYEQPTKYLVISHHKTRLLAAYWHKVLLTAKIKRFHLSSKTIFLLT